MLSHKILLVDDEELNLDLFARRLRRNGYHVDCVRDGRAALELVSAKQYDLVLLDQMMPEMSGANVLAALRANPATVDLPVILVTAVSDSRRIADSLDAGADDYITKPVDFAVAFSRIRAQLNRSHLKREMRLREERYYLAASGGNEGLWDWDFRTGEVFYSDSWKAVLGLAARHVSSAPSEWLDRVHPKDAAAVKRALDTYLKGDTPSFEIEARMLTDEGVYRWMSMRGMAARDSIGQPLHMAGSLTDVTGRIVTDSLTGLPNKIMLRERLSSACDPLESRSEYLCGGTALLLVDLDRFKLINDSLGHPAGDRLLIEAANRLRDSLREGWNNNYRQSMSLVTRLGSDEFGILLTHLPQGAALQQAAEQAAKRILDTLHVPLTMEDHCVALSASIGILLQPSRNALPEDILRDAEIATHTAKIRGKGRWIVFDPTLRNESCRLLQLESDLRQAIAKQQFEVYYQPRVRLSDGAICGFEALVRWNHPEQGIIPPDEFIPLAEETGLIIAIGSFVLRQACWQLQAWRRRFPEIPMLDVAVNLSPGQCRDESIIRLVSDILAETSLPPACLHLELTEGTLLKNFEASKKILQELKALGIGLKIDDFGTGYSSLRYLKELPFDSLKIDRSFTIALDGDRPSSIEMVRTILAMARNLNLGVIAEGVERAEHLAELQRLGCEFGQGYYFSRPVRAELVEDLLSKERSHIPGVSAL